MDKWIKVTKKMPEIGTSCIIMIGKTERDLYDRYTRGGPDICFAEYMRDPCLDPDSKPGFYWYSSECLFNEYKGVTAWIPCPDYDAECEWLKEGKP